MRVDVEVGEQLALLSAAAGGRVPPPARDLVVEPLVLVDDERPVEAPGGAGAGRSEPLARLALAHDDTQRGGEGAGVARWDEETLAAVGDELAVPGDVTSDDRRARRHRLEQHDAGGLRTQRGRAQHVRVTQEARHAVPRHPAVERHAAGERRRHPVAEAALLGVVTADVHLKLAGDVVEATQRPQKQAEALTTRLGSSEQDADRAGPPAVHRPEPRKVDPRRDEVVRAGEHARGQVAYGLAAGHGNVERVEEPLLAGPRHQVLGEAVVLVEEGRDERARGVAQRHPAEGRGERLVEMEEVEIVGLEEDVDVGDEIDRRVEHRAWPPGVDMRAPGEEVPRRGLLGREHGLAFAQQHRAYLGARLAHRRLVGARGDDGHAVAASGETLRESRDLVVHSARRGPGVRGQESDAVAHAANATAATKRRTGRGLVAPARPGRLLSAGRR